MEVIYRVPEHSKTIVNDLVLPNDANQYHQMFGGEILARMDKICCIAAQKHSSNICVTVSVNHVAFKKHIPLGGVFYIEAKVTRAFDTAMEVYAEIWHWQSDDKSSKAGEGIYTFVALDEAGKPIKIPKIKPETPLEQERYDAALRRRQLSLVLAKKMELKDATELKALLLKA